jgi:hypothetical protein
VTTALGTTDGAVNFPGVKLFGTVRTARGAADGGGGGGAAAGGSGATSSVMLSFCIFSPCEKYSGISKSKINTHRWAHSETAHFSGWRFWRAELLSRIASAKTSC